MEVEELPAGVLDSLRFLIQAMHDGAIGCIRYPETPENYHLVAMVPDDHGEVHTHVIAQITPQLPKTPDELSAALFSSNSKH